MGVEESGLQGVREVEHGGEVRRYLRTEAWPWEAAVARGMVIGGTIDETAAVAAEDEATG